MPDKSEETYQRFWDALNGIFHFKPESLRLDFEIANSNAASKVYGEDLQIWYCLFHLAKNCKSKICEKHMQRYQDPKEKEFATRCRMFPALAFIPIEEVIEVFEELVKYDKENGNLLPPEYVTYFEKNYIGSILRRNTRKTPR